MSLAPVTAKRPTANYVLQRSQQEYERLFAQVRIWSRSTQRALDELGPLNGRRLLDVGCGPGSLWPELAVRLGPRGELHGVDIDAAALSQGRVRLQGLSAAPTLRTWHAPLEQLSSLEAGQFDVVLARLFVFHQPDPVACLRRLAGWLRPGGRLLLLDFDCSVSCALDGEAQVDQAVQLCNAAFASAGLDPRRGTRLPALLQQAGLGEASWVDVAGRLLPRSAGIALLRQLLDSLATVIAARGLATEVAIRALDRQLQQLAEAPGLVRVPDQVAVCWQAPE
ncbi:MAG: class I SAM-dependent methyltransferase [Lysobacterales bacterium]